MLRFHTFVIFSCLLYGLAISDETETKEKVHYYPKTPSTAVSTTEDQLKPSTKQNAPMYMEGQFPTSIKSNSAKSNLIKTEEKKEGRTVGRKGAIYPMDKNNTLPDDHVDKHIDAVLNKTVVQKNSTSAPVTSKPQFVASSTRLPSSTSVKPTPTQRIVPVKEDVQEAKVKEVTKEKVSEVVTEKTTKKTPKPKPLITSAGKESDAQANEPIPALPTSKTPLGMPRKIDYIVPVVITITALPLLGVAFYVLYKRGRDYWDKRHYRRMDFLIDGMYNE